MDAKGAIQELAAVCTARHRVAQRRARLGDGTSPLSTAELTEYGSLLGDATDARDRFFATFGDEEVKVDCLRATFSVDGLRSDSEPWLTPVRRVCPDWLVWQSAAIVEALLQQL